MDFKVKILLGLLMTLIIASCSNSKVLASWKSDNLNEIKNNKKLLVIARTDNNQARIAFENQISQKLNDEGIKAVSSFSILPSNLKIGKELSEEQKAAFKEFMKVEGFDGVVLNVIKDLEETTKTYSDGGYYVGATIPFYPNYYNGFYSYYYNPYSYSTFGNYVDRSTTTYTYKTYVLETVVYDLNQKDGSQLVAVVTSQIDNPRDVDKNAEEFAKKIMKSIE